MRTSRSPRGARATRNSRTSRATRKRRRAGKKQRDRRQPVGPAQIATSRWRASETQVGDEDEPDRRAERLEPRIDPARHFQCEQASQTTPQHDHRCFDPLLDAPQQRTPLFAQLLLQLWLVGLLHGSQPLGPPADMTSAEESSAARDQLQDVSSNANASNRHTRPSRGSGAPSYRPPIRRGISGGQLIGLAPSRNPRPSSANGR